MATVRGMHVFSVQPRIPKDPSEMLESDKAAAEDAMVQLVSAPTQRSIAQGVCRALAHSFVRLHLSHIEAKTITSLIHKHRRVYPMKFARFGVPLIRGTHFIFIGPVLNPKTTSYVLIPFKLLRHNFWVGTRWLAFL
eukprot:scaffold316649_cov32-Prasinocladus_malaysianus.AAC.1